MKDRIREVRQNAGLSMEKFGSRIMISRVAVSYLEKGVNAPSPQTIKLICREFHINEEWLRNGTGEMHDETSLTEQLFQWAGETLKDEDSFRTDFLRMLMQLEPSDWTVIEKMARNLLKAQQEREGGESDEGVD